jgi:glycosyltransferase involved in cell wall biosynthesis
MSRIDPEHPRRSVEFVVLSFEGPDLYSLVGGLGVRVTEMTRVMAGLGYRTRLIFVGDPELPEFERNEDGLLLYHRWCRGVSAEHPEGVYSGEVFKVDEYRQSLPEFVVDEVVAPNVAESVTTVIMGEDWHTASALVRIHELLKERELDSKALLFWNANNVFGFETIDFSALQEAAQLMTVSRYMKERMRNQNLDAIVVPNGIPPRFWARVDTKAGRELRNLFPGLLLAKVGRYHPDKRWLMALESIQHCREMGLEPTLLVRGAGEEYGDKVREKAAELGLSWVSIRPEHNDHASILENLYAAPKADIFELDFFVPEAFLRTLYWACTAILANSGHEPFGLVGLEVMACSGVAVTGSTGEEYVQSFHNGIALSSDDPRELALYLQELVRSPVLANNLREQGRASAKYFNWDRIVEDILRKVELVAWMKGVEL